MKRSITLAALLALGAASFMPTAAMARADISVFIGTAPPAPAWRASLGGSPRSPPPTNFGGGTMPARTANVPLP